MATYGNEIVELLRGLGYTITPPKTVRGRWGQEVTFDISATRAGAEIVIDISSGQAEIGPEIVVTFFAKILETRPRRPILVCIPGLNRDARSLVSMYKMETVIGSNIEEVLPKLSELLGTQRETDSK
jgi:hypothetical protein